MKTFRSGALALVSLAVLTGAACEQGLQNPVAPGSPGAAVVGSAGLAAGQGHASGVPLHGFTNDGDIKRITLRFRMPAGQQGATGCYEIGEMGHVIPIIPDADSLEIRLTAGGALVVTIPADNGCGTMTLLDGGPSGAVIRGITRNPAGHFARVLNEDGDTLRDTDGLLRGL